MTIHEIGHGVKELAEELEGLDAGLEAGDEGLLRRRRRSAGASLECGLDNALFISDDVNEVGPGWVPCRPDDGLSLVAMVELVLMGLQIVVLAERPFGRVVHCDKEEERWKGEG